MSHKPGYNAPCYSNPDGVYHSFEKDINGKKINVIRTYSDAKAKDAMSAASKQARYDLQKAEWLSAELDRVRQNANNLLDALELIAASGTKDANILRGYAEKAIGKFNT